MTPRDTIEAAAQRFILKGQLDRALGEYRRLLEEDPNDVRALLKVGDLEVKLQNTAQAIQAYLKVAEHHSRQGFSLKAVAVLKQVVKLDPEHMLAATRLAALYEQLNLTSEAIAAQEAIFEHHRARRQAQEMANALTRLDALAGTSPQHLLWWSEIHQQQGRTQEACEALRQAKDQFKSLGQQEAWADAAEKLLELDPHLTGLACELARHHLARQEPKRALIRLQQAFRAAPQDTETLTLLAQVFEAIDQAPKAVTVLHELASQAKQRRQEAAFRRIIEHILRLDPDDKAAQAAQREGMTRVVDPSLAPQPAPPSSPADMGKLLIEAQIFCRYGLRHRALEYLDRLLAVFPEHPEALGKRQEIVADLARTQDSALADGPADGVVFAIDVDPAAMAPQQRNTLVRSTTVARGDTQLSALGVDIDALVAASDLAGVSGQDPAAAPALLPPPQHAETHMNLGTAYKEMGLFDEALAQFEIACGHEGQRAQALVQKGIVLVQLKRGGEALAVFEQALDAPELSNAQAAAALYECGHVYESQGAFDKARTNFAKCQAIDPQFHDVGQRLKRLQKQAEGNLIPSAASAPIFGQDKEPL